MGVEPVGVDVDAEEGVGFELTGDSAVFEDGLRDGRAGAGVAGCEWAWLWWWLWLWWGWWCEAKWLEVDGEEDDAAAAAAAAAAAWTAAVVEEEVAVVALEGWCEAVEFEVAVDFVPIVRAVEFDVDGPTWDCERDADGPGEGGLEVAAL